MLFETTSLIKMTSRRPAPVRQDIIGFPRQHVPPGTEFKVAIVTTCDDRITAVDFTALLTRTVEVDPVGHYAAKAQSGLMGQTSSEERVCKGHTLFQKFLVQKGRHIVNIPDVDGRGNNEAKLTLKIPDRCPDTWDGDNGLHSRISYKFAAIMRYKRWNSECTSRLPIVNTLSCLFVRKKKKEKEKEKKEEEEKEEEEMKRVVLHVCLHLRPIQKNVDQSH
ncbi:hypothetical protein ACOMHN_004926 [Nucella lapillus]